MKELILTLNALAKSRFDVTHLPGIVAVREKSVQLRKDDHAEIFMNIK